MTAEVAVLNKIAVSLAADSAVTIGTASGQKIYNTVNKLFMLSKHHPVGIMVFGNAGLIGVPWELAIKVFRGQLGDEHLPHLEDYGKRLFEFLGQNKKLFPPEARAASVETNLIALFSLIRSAATEAGGAQDAESQQRAVTAEIIQLLGVAEALECLPGRSVEDAERVLSHYEEALGSAVQGVFEGVPLDEASVGHLRRLAVHTFCKSLAPIEANSGVILAGFGEEDFFPTVAEYSVWGIAGDAPSFKEQRVVRITFDKKGLVLAFAQRDPVTAFMNGIAAEYREWLQNGLQNLLMEELPREVASHLAAAGADNPEAIAAALRAIAPGIMNSIREGMLAQSRGAYSKPILEAVEVMPKDELAALAESLVNLTSMRRRATLDAETVGGPIDVAVISKGDGFIWMKRKHYFKPELNPAFFSNYYQPPR
jgi:hypothetical protein